MFKFCAKKTSLILLILPFLFIENVVYASDFEQSAIEAWQAFSDTVLHANEETVRIVKKVRPEFVEIAQNSFKIQKCQNRKRTMQFMFIIKKDPFRYLSSPATGDATDNFVNLTLTPEEEELLEKDPKYRELEKEFFELEPKSWHHPKWKEYNDFIKKLPTISTEYAALMTNYRKKMNHVRKLVEALPVQE